VQYENTCKQAIVDAFNRICETKICVLDVVITHVCEGSVEVNFKVIDGINDFNAESIREVVEGDEMIKHLKETLGKKVDLKTIG
jgi:hypothetical protein